MDEKEQKAWREGFELGIKNALRQNEKELALGRAILAVLDERYEFHKEDY